MQPVTALIKHNQFGENAIYSVISTQRNALCSLKGILLTHLGNVTTTLTSMNKRKNPKMVVKM